MEISRAIASFPMVHSPLLLCKLTAVPWCEDTNLSCVEALEVSGVFVHLVGQAHPDWYITGPRSIQHWALEPLLLESS